MQLFFNSLLHIISASYFFPDKKKVNSDVNETEAI